MKKENSIKAEINVVPFIDVMLVLLIVFMITAPMLTQGIDVSLPKTSFSDSVQQNESVFFIVSMDKEGLLYFTNTDSKNNSSDPTDIKYVVDTILEYENNQENKDIKIFIKADEDLPYGKVVSLMDSLKKVSKNSIGLMTEQVSI